MGRVPLWRDAALIPLAVLVLALADCGSAGHPPAPAPSSHAQPAGGCTATATTAAQVEAALGKAHAGSRICVTGQQLREADLVVDRSGAAGRPLILVAEGTQVRSVTVRADHVVIQGFSTADGDGVTLRGRDLVARGNSVLNAQQDGISCEEICADVLIADNTVTRADGTGIIVEGRQITVRHNTVSRSVKIRANDADGIRFFGTGIEILNNTVTDIKHSGYATDPPHTDCFQTYDNSRIPTVNAVISGNVCRNVDDQCLIATAQESGRAGVIGRSRGIEFTGNTCDVGASQAVLVEWFPDVDVRGNILDGPALARAAIFLYGSTGCRFTDNSVPGGVRPYELDDSSRPGFSADRPG